MPYFIIVIICCCFLWITMFRRKSSDPPVASRYLPILGHIALLHSNKTAEELWRNIKQISTECMEKGGVLTVYFGNRAVYFITDPEDCLTISNACIDKDYIYDFTKNCFGTNLFNANAAAWKIKRKLLNPSFHQKVLNSFIGIFNEKAKKLLNQVTVDQPFYINELLMVNSLETFCLTAMGTNVDEDKGHMNYLNSHGNLLKIGVDRFLNFWYHVDFIYKFSRLKKIEDEHIKIVHEFTDSVIRLRKEEIKAAKVQNQIEQDKVKPFIEHILELANGTGCFTDEDVRSETNMFITAGYDTSANTLTYVFIMLGTYPDVQEKVYQEILQVIGNVDRNLEREDFTKLVYTDAVIKETLRLYPTGAVIARKTCEDIKLKNCTLRANSSCVLSIWGMHRHPIWGPDAEQFRSERWLSPEILHSACYNGSFSMGRRTCIGKGFAIMYMKTIISHVVRCYRVRADISNLKLKLDILLKPESGHHVVLFKRE